MIRHNLIPEIIAILNINRPWWVWWSEYGNEMWKSKFCCGILWCWWGYADAKRFFHMHLSRICRIFYRREHARRGLSLEHGWKVFFAFLVYYRREMIYNFAVEHGNATVPGDYTALLSFLYCSIEELKRWKAENRLIFVWKRINNRDKSDLSV